MTSSEAIELQVTQFVSEGETTSTGRSLRDSPSFSKTQTSLESSGVSGRVVI